MKFKMGYYTAPFALIRIITEKYCIIQNVNEHFMSKTDFKYFFKDSMCFISYLERPFDFIMIEFVTKIFISFVFIL